MMTTEAISKDGTTDAELVAGSLAGDREAFGCIVARYQSLVCSLAYSATGSLSQSEDLAQETFIAAWKQLPGLREPAKLRAWLCRIARNHIYDSLRDEKREPAHEAESLDTLVDAAAAGPLPTEQAINQEEEAILWRSVASIPVLYREPLILFYREHQSVERVAAILELSEDAVKQRLSRGRKLLQEQVLAFVEGALERTNPGKAFTIGVLTALPVLTISAKAATLGATAVKGSATAKAAAATGMLGAILSFPLAIFGNYIGYRMSIDSAQSDREREYIKSFYRRLIGCILGFFVVYAVLMFFGRQLISSHAPVFVGLLIGLALAYTLATIALFVWSMRRRRQFVAEGAGQGQPVPKVKPAWEYRSGLTLLGLPFVHIRVGGGMAAQKTAVKAWIAAGDCAVGLLFAFGGLAVAPFSIGGCAIGLLPFGGFALGVLALGGFSLGVWSFGGLAMGWQALGGCAIAWNAAFGGASVAHDFALGGIAQAAQSNNDTAAQFIQSNSRSADVPGRSNVKTLAFAGILA